MMFVSRVSQGLLALLLGGCCAAEKALDVAAELGCPADDATACVQKALDSSAAKVVLDGRDWVVEPLFIRRSNLELVLKDGCRLLAKQGAFKGTNDNLLKVCDGVTNVVIRGEGKATLEMRMSDYQDESRYRFAEWRHGLSTWGVTNVVLRNLTVTHTGGDGVYVNGSNGVLIEDVICVDNHRLGYGIISAENLTMRRCVGRDTCGTPPKCGIDFEPNKVANRFVNVLLEDCLFEGNESAGVLFHLNQLSDRTKPVSIVLRNCVSRGNGGAGYHLSATGEKGVVTGSVVFERCVSEGNRGDFSHLNKADGGIRVVLKDTAFKSVTTSGYVKPVDAVPIVFDELKPMAQDAPVEPIRSGWLREKGTFLQFVPMAGKYPLRFVLKKVGTREASASVQVRDKLGTDLGVFNVAEGEKTYTIDAKGANLYRFEITVLCGALEVVTPYAGGAWRADMRMHLYTGRNKAFDFRVPAGADKVRVEIVPEEACSARLVDPNGRVCDEMPHGTAGKVLTALRAANAPEEVWRLLFLKVDEDVRFRVGAPCEALAYPR